jgi:transposase
MEQERMAMNQKERDWLHWLKQAKEKKLTQKQAAEKMEVSERWVRTLLKKWKRKGDAVVVHALRGRASNHKIAEKTQRQAMTLVRREYADFGPTLASEYLAEKHQIQVSKETLRQWMIAAGIWKAGRAQLVKVHGWRQRRSCVGELVQWDTSEHAWLEERGPQLYLIAMIDDATSRVYARFAPHDSTAENMRTVWGYLERYGRPQDFYTDQAGLFVTTPKKRPAEEPQPLPPTQLGRALKQLGIGWIGAHSPQAKGRIERFFGTAQDRLVKGLRKAQAGNLETANRYLEETFLPMWNQRFIEIAANPADAHRPLLAGHDLAAILCRIEERTVANDYTFRWDRRPYQIDLAAVPPALRRARVAIQFRLDGSILVAFQDRLLNATLCQPGAVAVAPPPAPQRPPAKRRVYKRGSDWNRNFDLQRAPSLGQILSAEKKAGRL